MGLFSMFQPKQPSREELTQQMRDRFDRIIAFAHNAATASSRMPSPLLDAHARYRPELKYMTMNCLFLLFALAVVSKNRKSADGFIFAFQFMSVRLGQVHPMGTKANEYFCSFIETVGNPDITPEAVGGIDVATWYVRFLPYEIMPQEIGMEEIMLMQKINQVVKEHYRLSIRSFASERF